jgi:hypothetical protein
MDTPITISDKNKPARQTSRLTIGALIFFRMDQIDFAGHSKCCRESRTQPSM